MAEAVLAFCGTSALSIMPPGMATHVDAARMDCEILEITGQDVTLALKASEVDAMAELKQSL